MLVEEKQVYFTKVLKKNFNIEKSSFNEQQAPKNEKRNCKNILKIIRGKNKSKLIFTRIKIISIRNVFQLLPDQFTGNIYVLIMVETII